MAKMNCVVIKLVLRITGRYMKAPGLSWTGLEFAKSQRAVENREKGTKLVAKSSVVPQRPSRLRNG